MRNDGYVTLLPLRSCERPDGSFVVFPKWDIAAPVIALPGWPGVRVVDRRRDTSADEFSGIRRWLRMMRLWAGLAVHVLGVRVDALENSFTWIKTFLNDLLDVAWRWVPLGFNHALPTQTPRLLYDSVQPNAPARARLPFR